mgnify:CR=1 FL=1
MIMTAELLVNVTPSETRVAYIDGGILQEIHIEREARRGIVGNIYKGRVSRVLPGMQAAFVDIGLDKAAFLHASDIMPHTECVAGEEQKQLSKEFVRRWLIENGFQGQEGQQIPDMTDEYIETVSERYIELYENILGEKFIKADISNINERIEKNVLNYLESLK